LPRQALGTVVAHYVLGIVHGLMISVHARAIGRRQKRGGGHENMRMRGHCPGLKNQDADNQECDQAAQAVHGGNAIRVLRQIRLSIMWEVPEQAGYLAFFALSMPLNML